MLRGIATDPHGFILRHGWASLDFSDEAELTQLRRLYESLQLEIVTALEALGQLRESPEYELCQISMKKAGVLDELAAERASLLEKERLKKVGSSYSKGFYRPAGQAASQLPVAA
jgi:DNA polymerase-3 subunit epsilon